MKQFIKDLFSDKGQVSSQRVQLIWQMVLLTALVVLWFIIALESYNWKLDVNILDKLNYAVGIITGGTTLKLFQSIFVERKDGGGVDKEHVE